MVRASQLFWSKSSKWTTEGNALERSGLVFYFSARQMLADGALYDTSDVGDDTGQLHDRTMTVTVLAEAVA